MSSRPTPEPKASGQRPAEGGRVLRRRSLGASHQARCPSGAKEGPLGLSGSSPGMPFPQLYKEGRGPRACQSGQSRDATSSRHAQHPVTRPALPWGRRPGHSAPERTLWLVLSPESSSWGRKVTGTQGPTQRPQVTGMPGTAREDGRATLHLLHKSPGHRHCCHSTGEGPA